VDAVGTRAADAGGVRPHGARAGFAAGNRCRSYSLGWHRGVKPSGVAAGAAAVQALHAQAKPPAYVVAEIDVTNLEPYDKEYVPPAAKAIADAGGKYVVRGGRTVAIFGQPPQPRIAVMVFESMEKANAAFESSAYKEAKTIGDKYAKFRVYAVEGLLQ